MSEHRVAPYSDAWWQSWAMARYQARLAALDHEPTTLERIYWTYEVGSELMAAIGEWRRQNGWRARLARWLHR